MKIHKNKVDETFRKSIYTITKNVDKMIASMLKIKTRKVIILTNYELLSILFI